MGYAFRSFLLINRKDVNLNRQIFNLRGEPTAGELARTMHEATTLLVSSAKLHHEPHSKTKRLLGAIEADVFRQVGTGSVIGLVGVDEQQAPHGPWREHGTGLFGKFRRAYRVGGRLVPGQRGEPYLQPAFHENHLVVRQMFDDAGHRIAFRLSTHE